MSKDSEFQHTGLKHGGRVIAAAEKYGILKSDWLDLSTGLNPNGWMVSDVPASIWQTLPEDDDGLQTAACQYYGCEYCLPIAGSQAAIQTLPTLRSFSKVGVISPTYAEHEYNWKQAGHDVIQLTVNDIDDNLEQLDVLVVINPNNPTGEIIPVEKLLKWHQQLSTKGGWLIVDEAFMDVTPENSLLATGFKPGLIILRSLGKFFGLAGIRCGFIISDKELLQRVADKLGPWSLTGPTRYIAKKALQDKQWHKKTIYYLKNSSKRLHNILTENYLEPNGGTALFQWVNHPKAKEIFEVFAKQGILIRYFEESVFSDKQKILPSLRFGLPANEEQWLKLSNVLKVLPNLIKITKKNNKNDLSYV